MFCRCTVFQFCGSLFEATSSGWTLPVKLNYLLVQPQVSYRVTAGKPYLGISAEAGGFAQFEYYFASKVWNHYS